MIDLEKLRELRVRHEELGALTSRPGVASDPRQMARLGPELRELADVVEAVDRYEAMLRERDELREMIRGEDDDEIVKMAKEEFDAVSAALPGLEQVASAQAQYPGIRRTAKAPSWRFVPGREAARRPFSPGTCIVFTTGMPSRRGGKISLMNTSEGAAGGFKEIIFGVSGRDVFGQMKYESGVHRVQRVPETEASGRLHTSAATVAVCCRKRIRSMSSLRRTR